jgi:polyisoprenoid-binding protein YceI
VTGTITIDAASLNTRNKQRDKHLRSADFFHVANHPQVVITIGKATPAGPDMLACTGTIEAAGHTQPAEFTAHVETSADAAILTAEITLDRTIFGMTWSPMRVAAYPTRATLTARFTR